MYRSWYTSRRCFSCHWLPHTTPSRRRVRLFIRTSKKPPLLRRNAPSAINLLMSSWGLTSRLVPAFLLVLCHRLSGPQSRAFKTVPQVPWGPGVAEMVLNSVFLGILLYKKRGTAASSISSMIPWVTMARGMEMPESARVYITAALAYARLEQSSL